MSKVLEELLSYPLSMIIEEFLKNPSQEYYLRELARKLGLGPRTVKEYCDILVQDGIILERRKGNLRLFKLNNKSLLVKELIRAYYYTLMIIGGIEKLSEGTIAVYGDFASGNIFENSEVKILIISSKYKINEEILRRLESVLERKTKILIVSPEDWERMKNLNDPLAKEIIKNHILVKGDYF